MLGCVAVVIGSDDDKRVGRLCFVVRIGLQRDLPCSRINGEEWCVIVVIRFQAVANRNIVFYCGGIDDLTCAAIFIKRSCDATWCEDWRQFVKDSQGNGLLRKVTSLIGSDNGKGVGGLCCIDGIGCEGDLPRGAVDGEGCCIVVIVGFEAIGNREIICCWSGIDDLTCTTVVINGRCGARWCKDWRVGVRGDIEGRWCEAGGAT